MRPLERRRNPERARPRPLPALYGSIGSSARRRFLRFGMAMLLAAALFAVVPAPRVHAQEGANRPLALDAQPGAAALLDPTDEGDALDADHWLGPAGLSSTLKIMILLTVLSLAPAVLVMTTCFVRMVVVLGLLRQAIGTQQLPPSQVITSLALFLTLLVMAPVWQAVYADGVAPYTAGAITGGEAWERGVAPVRRFMAMQIDRAGNADDVWLFLQYVPEEQQNPQAYDDVPLQALLPAFLLSELKVAFLIGFQLYLPFLIIDMVVSSVLISMGMLMLPPVLISLPFKLLLFVLVDGWTLVVGMLLESVVPYV